MVLTYIRPLLVSLSFVAYITLTPPAHAQEHRSDQRLQIQIERQLDQNLRAVNSAWKEKIEVRVSNGVASLSGELPSYSDRAQVQRLCERVEGLVRVDNRIAVVPPIVHDSTLQRSVADRLKADSMLRGMDIKTEVNGGIVTLTGTTSTWADRRSAASIARQVHGVLDVRNEIELVTYQHTASKQPSDSQITHQLESLFSHDSPFAKLDIQFDVSHRRVVLQGVVNRLIQKDVLVEIVRSTPGVLAVDAQQVVLSRAPAAAAAESDVDLPSTTNIAATIRFAADALITPELEHVAVSIDHDSVVLSGTVQSLARQNQLMRLAKAFSQSLAIRNDLQVIPIARDDAEIESEFKTLLANDNWLKDGDISVAVANAHVVLSGKVSDFNSKARLDRIASRIPGLSRVTNHTTVAWSPHFADDGLKKSIEKRLRGEELAGLTVSVMEGVATIGGVANSEALQRAREIVELTDGVRSVRLSASSGQLVKE